MSELATANTEVCSEYQRLLERSLNAREILNEHRAEICRSPSVEEATVDEVLRSQRNTLKRTHCCGIMC